VARRSATRPTQAAVGNASVTVRPAAAAGSSSPTTTAPSKRARNEGSCGERDQLGRQLRVACGVVHRGEDLAPPRIEQRHRASRSLLRAGRGGEGLERAHTDRGQREREGDPLSERDPRAHPRERAGAQITRDASERAALHPREREQLLDRGQGALRVGRLAVVGDLGEEAIAVEQRRSAAACARGEREPGRRAAQRDRERRVRNIASNAVW
jgi:hypothetical protein